MKPRTKLRNLIVSAVLISSSIIATWFYKLRQMRYDVSRMTHRFPVDMPNDYTVLCEWSVEWDGDPLPSLPSEDDAAKCFDRVTREYPGEEIHLIKRVIVTETVARHDPLT